jgi:hypothetical protein
MLCDRARRADSPQRQALLWRIDGARIRFTTIHSGQLGPTIPALRSIRSSAIGIDRIDDDGVASFDAIPVHVVAEAWQIAGLFVAGFEEG